MSRLLFLRTPNNNNTYIFIEMFVYLSIFDDVMIIHIVFANDMNRLLTQTNRRNEGALTRIYKHTIKRDNLMVDRDFANKSTEQKKNSKKCYQRSRFTSLNKTLNARAMVRAISSAGLMNSEICK